MPYYRFDNGLQPLSAPPEDWQGVLAVLEPSELHSAPLPSWLTPPAAPADPHESQFCWLRIDRDGVTGHLRTPVRASQSARHMGFTWTRDCLLLSDPDHAAADCIAHLTTQRTQPPGSPDAFVVALLIALIRDDLPYIQQLETRLTNLEQAVLDNETGRFLHQMSVIRKELNRANRFYAQLGDFASSLQEYAGDLFDTFSAKRFDAFLRRADALREETRMLREYASQISSEYQAQVDIQQNRVMKLLTIVTTIFLPLSLLVGWYGMNFQGMPELSWTYGYPAVIAVSVLLAVGLIVYFKRKHWF